MMYLSVCYFEQLLPQSQGHGAMENKKKENAVLFFFKQLMQMLEIWII